MRLLFAILQTFLWVSVVIATNIPEELRALPQWVLWKFLPGKATPANPDPKPRKVPFKHRTRLTRNHDGGPVH